MTNFKYLLIGEKPVLTHGIVHAGFRGLLAFVVRIKGRSKLKGNRFVIPHDTIPSTVVIVGEPTGARPNMVGSITRFVLPNSGLNCFTAKEYNQDYEFTDFRLATEPHVCSLISSDDYRENHDPVLSTIFNYESIKQLKAECIKEMQ